MLSIDGRTWRDGARLYVPRWHSHLSALKPNCSEDDWKRFFDWLVETKFTGTRVFAGRLTWANQYADGARLRLPKYLDVATAFGLAVEVVACTDSAEGSYDIVEQLCEIAAIGRGRSNVGIEGGNEFDHPSQFKDIEELLARYMPELFNGMIWSMGAPFTDEIDVHGTYQGHINGAKYDTAHLDRGRDPWNMARRVRELLAVSEASGCPCLNNEPMGADELDGSVTGKQRMNDPAIFACLGALDRGFPGIGGVHHSQAGLQAEVSGPVQQLCATAYISGHLSVDAILNGQPGSYRNTGWADSPVTLFAAGDAVRCYSFVNGTVGAMVEIGVRDGVNMQFQNGWRHVSERYRIAARDGSSLVVSEIAQ